MKVVAKQKMHIPFIKGQLKRADLQTHPSIDWIHPILKGVVKTPVAYSARLCGLNIPLSEG